MVSINVRPLRTVLFSARRGNSLLETVFALFLFAVAVLFVASSADFALRAGNRSNREARAAFVAQSRLAQLREWSQQGNNFLNYTSYPGLGSWQPDDFGFTTRVELVRNGTYTPCSASESFLAAADRRSLDASLLRARVRVSWGPGPFENYQLVSEVGDSRRGWRGVDPIVITPVSPPPVPLPQDQMAAFEVTGYDSAGQAIPDLTFSWAVVPGTSNGLFENQSADGRRATFRHHVYKVPGPGFDFGPTGEVWVQAVARFWGIEQAGRYLLVLQ